MTTNVPPPEFTDVGFVSPSPTAILEGVQADINASFGSVLSYSLTTPQGQLAQSWAAILQNVDATFQYYTQQVDPSYASGRMQDAIGRIYFMERNPSEPTALQIECLGLAGVLIPVGATIQDVSGNLYQCTGSGTIPVGGTVALSFACTTPGPIAVPGTNDVSIFQSIPGWDQATVLSGVVGSNVEGRAQFEQRRRESVAGNSFGPIGAIIGAVAGVPDVLDYFGYNNNTVAPVTLLGVEIPAYSIYICVAGGTDQDVASAILSKKSAGAPMIGNTEVTVFDENPLFVFPPSYVITFERPTDLQVLINVLISNGPNVPSDADIQIQDALLAAFAGEDGGPKARIGSLIYATRFVPPIAALGTWAQVAQIGVGSSNAPDATFVGNIAGNTLTVTTLTTGTIAIGQRLTDLVNDLIVEATTVTGFGTGVGGAGTYTINNPQSVAGAVFTGTAVGDVLTASAVTGTIGVGNVLSGTGIPASTTVLEQLSGTTGGAGTYRTSVVTTAAADTISANAPIVSASGNDESVQVDINQSPQLAATNITVTLT